MEFRKITLVGGGGFMGRSLAQKMASSGIDVTVLEVSEERIAQAREAMANSLDDELRKWGITASEKKVVLSRVTFTTDPTQAADCDLAIEAVPEDLALKQAVMLRLDAVCRPETVFVTSTSTLSVTEIAAASGRSDRVVGMHFMHPVTRSKIVEIVRGSETSDETFAKATALARTLEKTMIEVFEYPGYVVTRAVVPFVNEAMHIVMEGVASAEDVDLALRLGFEFKMGPLEYADRVGLDTMLGWMEHLFRELGDFKYRPCPLLRKMVRAGHLGRKAGRGFFEWKGNERVRSEKEVSR
ncbi:MAG: 3-hydroxybutyryl-CoA dehydrogenase [Candidatus Eisenbacteria bacterium]|nr:3-hydroxybutyryl-CoA dehydrogenase [Candidatus Eisenbacteria bacterium]MBP8136803.1 3-hydroxybutyryl-CoA dehydrogenase [Candidatus Eisenbacteria bacterium]